MGACGSICGGNEQLKGSDNGKPHGLGHNIRNFTNTMQVTEPALADQYRGIKKLGGGSAGEIWLCRNLSAGQPDVALKLFPRPFEAGPRDTLLRECQVEESRVPTDFVASLHSLNGKSLHLCKASTARMHLCTHDIQCHMIMSTFIRAGRIGCSLCMLQSQSTVTGGSLAKMADMSIARLQYVACPVPFEKSDAHCGQGA